MAKETKPKPKDEDIKMEPSPADTGARAYTGKVYYVKRINYLLSQAYEVEVVNGVFGSEKAISVPDMPSTTIGTASKHLWSQVRGES
jgi:hypothetical protein